MTPTSTTRRENCAARRSRRSPKATSNRWPTSACSSTARTSGSPRKRAIVHDARLALADLCILSNRIAEGEEWVEQVLDEYPEDAAALNELGYLWADQGVHLDRALKMIRKAVAAKPDKAAYRDSLGWVLYRLGRNAEAVAELRRLPPARNPTARCSITSAKPGEDRPGGQGKQPGGARPPPSAKTKDEKKSETSRKEKPGTIHNKSAIRRNRTHVRPFPLVHDQTQKSGR